MTNTDPRNFLKAPAWFWIAVALGAALRLYLVIWTEGTTDVTMWVGHARDVAERGMVGYYAGARESNHPPFISEVESLLWRAANATGVPFRILLRAPFALLDAGTAFLLLLILRDSAWRFLIVAVYWLNPLGWILSAYHGNTDTAIGFLLLLCVWLLGQDKLIPAAIVFGVSVWIKLPAVLAGPVLFLAAPGWRRRFVFLGVAGAVAISTYLPVLFQDAGILYERVFAYRPQNVHTVAGVPTWGPRVILFSFIAQPQKWPISFRPPILFFLENGWRLALALAILFAWRRRARRSAKQLGATIGVVYLIIYALSDGWSFQYFGWSLPFWFLLPAWFFIPAVTATSAYFYSLYSYVCGNPWLLGQWDFAGHPYWPAAIVWFRNLAVLILFAGAWVFFTRAFLEKAGPTTDLASPAVPARP
jgi:hypothetical protein